VFFPHNAGEKFKEFFCYEIKSPLEGFRVVGVVEGVPAGGVPKGAVEVFYLLIDPGFVEQCSLVFPCRGHIVG